MQLGANAILAVSLAVAKAGAGVKGVPLYQVSWTHPAIILKCYYVSVVNRRQEGASQRAAVYQLLEW